MESTQIDLLFDPEEEGSGASWYHVSGMTASSLSLFNIFGIGQSSHARQHRDTHDVPRVSREIDCRCLRLLALDPLKVAAHLR
jgi:hypothetical protein